MERRINSEIRAADMFTADHGARKWDEMYSSQEESFLQYISRARRDYTLAFIEANYDKKSRILDLGCGAGPVISELNKQGYNCYASDFSKDILDKAKSRIIALSNNLPPIIQSDCQQIPLASNCMDLIVSLGVISYVPDRVRAIREMFRVLSEQGTLIITFRNTYNLIMRDPAKLSLYITKNLMSSIRRSSRETISKPGDRIKPSVIQEELASNGFSITETHCIGRGPFRLAGRNIIPEPWQIRMDKRLSKFLSVFGIASRPLGADFVIYVCKKA